MKILLTDREGLTAYLRFPRRTPSPHPPLELHRTHLRRNPPPRKGYRPLPRRDQLHQHRVGRARPRIPRLARTHHDPRRAAPAPRPAPQPAPTTPATAAPHTPTPLTAPPKPSTPPRNITHRSGTSAGRFTPDSGRHPETVFADLIDGPLAHMPSGRFGANSAWVLCAAIAHNLLRAAATLAGGPHAVARGATLRRKFVNIPARLARPQRRPVLHLPPHWPWLDAWLRLWHDTIGQRPPPLAIPA